MRRMLFTFVQLSTFSVVLLISCTALIYCNTNYYTSYTSNPIFNIATYMPSNDIGMHLYCTQYSNESSGITLQIKSFRLSNKAKNYPKCHDITEWHWSKSCNETITNTCHKINCCSTDSVEDLLCCDCHRKYIWQVFVLCYEYALVPFNWSIVQQ